MSEPPAEDDVRAAVREALGSPPRELTLRPVVGGASRDIWMVVADGRKLVLRRDPAGAGEERGSRATEFALLRAVHAAGVPVPEPLLLEPAGGRFGTAGFLLEWVEGEAVPPRILRAVPERFVPELAAALARVHAVDAAGLLPAPAGHPAEAAIGLWEPLLREVGERSPVIELGLRWLRTRMPEPVSVPLALVHGDFRMGNLVASPIGLAGVLDWEFAHLGDPAEDVGWLCVRTWRFGADALAAGGVASLADFLAAYEAAGGAVLEPERVRWWEAFGYVKWAIMCVKQVELHLSGEAPSLEKASLGRRIPEIEHDLLALIEEAG
jgi:aminoglycoside phosphotransferase (APT) family kinase protein